MTSVVVQLYSLVMFRETACASVSAETVASEVYNGKVVSDRVAPKYDDDVLRRAARSANFSRMYVEKPPLNRPTQTFVI